MSKVEIYYFSGTGNSLSVARDIAQKLDAELISVVSLMDRKSINSNADIIGFVFPIYDFKAPQIIESFIAKLTNIEAKYLFAVCTYGIAPSQSLKHFSKIIGSSRGELSGGFAVAMPHNGIGSGVFTKEQHEKMFMDWNTKLTEICEYINAGRKGMIESSSLFVNFFQPCFLRALPTLFKFLAHMLFKGVDSLALTSDNNCSGCGTCESVCPLKNIEIIDNRPKWSNNCTNCFACLNWCPKRAISVGGIDLNIKGYHHPDVNISDIL